MSKLNIQNCTSPKQHDQHYKAQVVVDCNDAIIETEREQEYHTRIRLTHQEISTKIAGPVNSKLKAKVFESNVLIYIDQLFTITSIESRKKELIVGKFLELKMVPTHKILRMQSDKF